MHLSSSFAITLVRLMGQFEAAAAMLLPSPLKMGNM